MGITWEEINSVNVKEIDGQHKILLSIINKLDGLRKSNDRVAINDIFRELREYVNFHFKTEEKYFDLFAYAGKDSHKTEHSVYIEKINDLEKKYQSGDVAAIDEIVKFLHNWWIMHINSSDLQYSDCFNDNGLF